MTPEHVTLLCPEMMANVGIHGATLCPGNMTKRDISAAAAPPAYFARRWPDQKRRAVAECAAGRTVAEVAAHVGVSRATVARWRRQPEFAAAIAYGKQEGRCGGCKVHFELRNMEVDHIVARVKGGPDHISNYQLLCGSCNRRKGAGSQAELIAKLKRDGIIAA